MGHSTWGKIGKILFLIYPKERAIRAHFGYLRRPWTICFLALTVILLQIVGCDSSTPEPKPSSSPDVPIYGGVFKRAFSSGVLTLDPCEVSDSFSHEVCRQIFDGLVEFDPEGKVVPALADKWTISQDGLIYTMMLRPNCRFQAISGPNDLPTQNGGRLVTAEDVEYTFRRVLTPKILARRAKLFWVIKGARQFNEGAKPSIEGIKVISSDTVSFTLEKPFAPFLSLLALSNTFILPKEDVEHLKKDFAWSPVGTGPFIWGGKSGETIILKANQNYFRGRPYLDRIEFPIIPDESESFAAFKRGELMDVAVPDPEYKNVKQDPVWAPYFQESSRWGTYYLGFNVATFPFDNIKVRQAINYAIDREAIVKLILNDRARVANGVLPPGILAYNNALKGYSYNLEKAKTLLAEAGYPDGKGFPEITLQINRDSIHSRTSEFILANLRDLGINCNIKEVEFQEHLATLESGKAPFFRSGWTVDYPDPDDFLYTLFHSENIGSGMNFGCYSNAKVDDLLTRARNEIDTKKRIELYQRAEEYIVDDAPWVFIYHYTTHLLCQSYVRGLAITPMGTTFILYRKAWFAKTP